METYGLGAVKPCKLAVNYSPCLDGYSSHTVANCRSNPTSPPIRSLIIISMKYRLKKELPWASAGEIITVDNINEYDEMYFKNVDSKDTLVADFSILPSAYPDFFEPINEEDEEDQEAIKRLESRGYHVEKLLNRFWVCAPCGVRGKAGQLNVHICNK